MTSKHPPPPNRPAPPVPTSSTPTPSTSAAPPAPSLQESITLSTESWQQDLHTLFRNTKEWFPDVVWQVGVGVGVDGEVEGVVEEVWGHKAIVYARAPPSFQSRYFQFRPSNASTGALSPSPTHSPARTPTPTLPGNSALSLNLGGPGLGLDMQLSRSPSPLRATSRTNGGSPVPSMTANGVPITRLQTSITPALFSNELEYLYTGQGFGEAFEFLFDDNGGELGLGAGDLGDGREGEAAQELRLDKLRKDLVFMWRSRLYSDVKISLTMSSRPQSGGELTWTGWTGSSNKDHENTTAVFSTHKFILVSRSSYFRTLLLANPINKLSSLSSSLSSSISSTPGAPPVLTLPSPPFTPASLHFTLGYLYTGTLAFSHRTYDLTTALHIYLSALPTYLNLPSLRDEVRGRIIVELCHGLFHAFLEFGEYEALVRGVRGGATSAAAKRMSTGIGAIGGCRCRSCARRAPRILQFVSYLAGLKNVSDPYLDRGARRALVGLLGDGWVTNEWASMDSKLRDSVLRGVKKRVSAEVGGGSAGTGDTGGGNIWNMLFAVEGALAPQGRLAKAIASASKAARADKVMDDPDARDLRDQGDKNWYLVVRADLFRAREMIDETLAERVVECFTIPPPPSVEEDVQYSDWHEILLRASPTYQQHSPKSGHTRHHRLASIVSSLSPSTLTPSNASDVSVPVHKGTLSNGNSPATAYEDAHNLSLILSSLIRGLRPSNAPLVYQTLVSNVLLLRAHPDPDSSGYQSMSMSVYDDDPYGMGGFGANALLLPPTSHVRIQVEEVRLEVLRWMSVGNRWKEVRDQGGFVGKEGEKDGLMEQWALKEIADHLQVPVDELLQAPSNTRAAGSSRVTSPTPSRDRLRPRNDSDRETVSIHSTNSISPSMRVSILSKNLPVKSSASSVRSVSTVGSANTVGRRVGRKATTPTAQLEKGERPDSKLTPQDIKISLEEEEEEEEDKDGDQDTSIKSTPTPSTLVSTPPQSRVTSRVVSPSPSTKRSGVTSPSPSASNKRLASSRSSVKSMSSTTSSISPRAPAARSPSTRPRSTSSSHSTLSTRSTASKASTTSTVRRHNRGGGGALQVPPVPVPRPISASTSGTSGTSAASGSSATSDFHTAPSSGTPRQRERTVSGTSTGSVRSTRSTKSVTPSTRSTASTGARAGTTTKRPSSVTGSVKSLRASPADKARAQAQAAVAANKSGAKTLGTKPQAATKTISKKASSDTIKGEGSSKSSSRSNTKNDTLAPPVPPLPSSSSSSPTPSTSGTSSPAAARDHLPSPPTETEGETEPYPTHLGATLSIGIPCIVTSKRKRFRAFARYIGEVEGERGPWVGVEVPINDSSERDKDKDVVMGDSRPWNDGSWQGIRYFDLLSKTQSGSGEAEEEWGDGSYGDSDRPSTRRRRDREMPSAFTKGTKRRVDQWSGDSQSTSRYNTMSSKRMRMGMGIGRSASPSMSDGGYGSSGYGMGATESRGLFVRPQQVLYVVDAIDGDDL
ncbi:hypothetical protein GYMLUDRAFT_68088 [Collybiopsis luxurians FD-317 M1]|nr:hypothetical protein GYMLUDRAFT_68088 [Collybiopsis luxurians FD-317 M1]